MTKKPRHSRKKLRPGAGSRSRHVASKGKAVHDEPARKAARAAAQRREAPLYADPSERARVEISQAVVNRTR